MLFCWRDFSLTIFTDDFKKRLVQTTGLTESAIHTAWPNWWTDEAESSVSARNELKFSVARKLGLDPRSLADEGSPRFIWDGSSAKYKNYTGDEGKELPAITSFGTSIARILTAACANSLHNSLTNYSALQIRESILKNAPTVSLKELLSLAWGLAIPVIHLRTYPLSSKRMCAMAINVSDRHVILLAKDSQYPASIAFHLAHEIGHIALGHLDDSQALVDMDEYFSTDKVKDVEETAADKFALELLTGSEEPQIIAEGAKANSRSLAKECIRRSSEYGIEPGTLALCYGYFSSDWKAANGALSNIYAEKHDVWKVVNAVANKQLLWNEISDDNANYLKAIMGGS